MNDKVIIPNLIQIKTSLRKIHSFELCDDINFFEGDKDIVNNYKVLPYPVESNRKIRRRIGNFNFSTENSIFYIKKIYGLTIYFEYSFNKKTFFYSSLYSKVPFQIGSIFPLGKYISAIIRYELFLKDFLTILGGSFSIKRKNYIVLGESYGGKTTLINMFLSQGGEYISEDMVVLNYKKGELFSTAVSSNMGRESNHKLKSALLSGNRNKAERKIDGIIFLGKKEAFKGYIQMHGMNFLENPLMKALIADNCNLTELFDKIKEIQHTLLKKNIIFETNLKKITQIIGN